MTMANEQRLRIIIEAIDRASQTIANISQRMAAQFRQVGRQMLLLGGIIAGFVTIAIKAATNQQVAFDNLRGSLELMGLRYEDLRDRIDPFIKELDRLSKFNRTELTQAFATILDITHNVDAAFRLLPSAAMVASGTGKPLQEVAAIIGKAIRGDDGAIQALQDLGVRIGLTKDSIKQSGIEITVADVASKMGVSFQDASRVIQSALTGELGAVGALASFGIIVRSGRGDINGLEEAIRIRFGPSLEAANSATARITGSLVLLSATIGKELAPVLIPLANAFAFIVVAITDWMAAHEKLSTVLIASVAILGALALGVGALALGIGLALPVLATMAAGFGAIGAAIGLLTPILAGIIISVGAMVATIVILATHWDEVTANVTRGAKNMARDFQDLASLVLAAWAFMWNGIQTVASTAVGAVLAIIDALKAAFDTLVNIVGKIPSLVPNISLPSIPNPLNLVPGFQHGGIVQRPTLAMIGESGPEAVVPLGMSRPGLGQMTVININGPIFGIPELKKVIIDAVREQATRGGWSGVFRNT